jgi:hypothetical protein
MKSSVVTSRCDAAPLEVRLLWTDLVARLSLAAQASRQTPARQQLHALGLRRVATAATLLKREEAMARRMAASAGAPIEPARLRRRILELAQPATLAWHLDGLTQTYRRIQIDPATPPAGPLHEWLAGRLRVHLAQADALAAIGGRVARPGQRPGT